ncbi:MAG: potassium channel family protein [Desulfatibacillaceae bacterium]
MQCQHLGQGPVEVVVVDREEDATHRADADSLLYVNGEATDEHTLLKAGIDQAAGLVAALGADTDNVFVVLSARQARPDLFIMARANIRETVPKLMAAGANKVSSPYDIVAKRMAEGILRPTVTGFLDLTLGDTNKEIQMEEIPIAESSPMAGQTLAGFRIRQDLNLIVVAIKRKDGTMAFNPYHDARLSPGETVIVVGEWENLSELGKRLNPR